MLRRKRNRSWIRTKEDRTSLLGKGLGDAIALRFGDAAWTYGDVARRARDSDAARDLAAGR